MSIARTRLVTAAIFFAFVAATVARGIGPFKWDAAHYWSATQAMIGLIPAVPEGYWELRGVFTPFIYAPAAALSGFFDHPYAGNAAVLLQNSVVFAVAAVFLLPAVVRLWQPVSTLMRVVAAVLLWAATSGFAAYALVDVYPALGILSLLILVRVDRRWVLFAAGVIAGVAMNIRPAYLVVVVLIVIVVVIWRRAAGLLMPAGVAVALIPQSFVSGVGSGSLSPLPAGSDALVALQSGYASYVVRYDTMIGDASARQFFCSPEMARIVGDAPPQSAGELALTLLESLPTSLMFSFEKISASLNWHAITPYTAATRPLDVVYGAGITMVAVIGIVALFFAATRRIEGKRDNFGIAMLTVVAAGTALTLVSSATETRFALMLVLLGAIGITVIAGRNPLETWRTGRLWILTAVATAAVVLAVGAIGLDHPAPRGDVTASICAAA